MNYKKLFHITFISLIVVLLGICSFVVIVDPYQQYHKSDIFIGNQRLEIPGVIKHHDYDMVLTGSSMAMNHYCSQVDSLFDCKSINFSYMGATCYDYEHLFPILYKEGKVKKIIMSIDFFSFCRQYVPLDLYLYDDNKWNDYEYWLNYTSIKNSINKIVKHNVPSRDSVYRFSSPCGKEHLMDVYQLNKHKYFKGEPYQLNLLKENFRKMEKSLFSNKYSVDFYFYFPPYSIFEYKLLEQYGYWNDILQFKEFICEELLTHENIKIFDFQSDSMVYNLDEYMDIRHHSHRYSKKIIDYISKDSCIITPFNYKENILKWNNMVKKYKVILKD